MNRGHWRRWRPSYKTKIAAPDRNLAEKADVFRMVEALLGRLSLGRHFWKRERNFNALNDYIDDAKNAVYQSRNTERAQAWLYLLVLQAPRAAVAQESMDRHPHGYHDKSARLFELIDFNDAFVAAILALPKEDLSRATVEIKKLCELACKQVGTRCFSDTQFEAIVHGLSREIAVYHGLKQEGYEVEMTNRTSDALGIDMRVTSPMTLSTVNIDIKTRSSYHYRIEQLRREGRLDDDSFLMADRNGFAVVYNGRDAQKVRVVVWRIDHETLGDLVDFRFEDTRRLGEQMKVIMLAAGDRR